MNTLSKTLNTLYSKYLKADFNKWHIGDLTLTQDEAKELAVHINNLEEEYFKRKRLRAVLAFHLNDEPTVEAILPELEEILR